MRLALLTVVLVGIVAAFVGLLALGAFPPQPLQHEIQKVLPNDHFASH